MTVLKQKYVENQLKVTNAENEAERASELALQAQEVNGFQVLLCYIINISLCYDGACFVKIKVAISNQL